MRILLEFPELLFGLMVAGLSLIVYLRTKTRLEELRRKGLLPGPGETPTDEHVRNLIRAGEAIPAMKLYRDIHGVGLKDAKEAIAKFAELLREENPYRPAASGQAKGSEEDIYALIRKGEMLPAIGMYMEVHGVDMKAATLAVKRLKEEILGPGKVR